MNNPLKRGCRPLIGARTLLCLCLLPAVQAAAQQTGVGVYEEELRVKLDEQIPEARELGFDEGGWFNFAFFHFNDSERQRDLAQYEFRPWASFNAYGVHRFYVRGLFGFDEWSHGANPLDTDDDQVFRNRLERAWYQFDLGQMLRDQTGRTPPVSFKFKVGREYASIGTALTLSMPLDMLQWQLSAGDWEVMALLGQTITHTPNIDISPPVSDHQDRCIWGAQTTYKGIEKQRPFVYFLSNEDHTKPWGSHPADQGFNYTSQYVGAGSEGTVILPDLRYQAEVVGEWGETYSNGVRAGRDPIEAMAIDALLEYLFRTKTHPKVMAEYLFGSGDSDRSYSAVSTIGGNRPGTADHAFNAFGFRDTGIAFAPRISNLHTYILGASFFPLEHIRLLEKMEVGSKAFFYQKARSAGAISDPTGDNDAGWVGCEGDIYCNWRITSDVSWTIRYGAFFPGDAFDSSSCRQFLYTGLTFSF